MLLKKIMSIPKSLYYSVKLFGLKGLKMPLLISCDTKVYGIKKNSIAIENLKSKVIQIGFGGSAGITSGGVQ